MAGVIRELNPLILAVEDAPQLCCGVVHSPFKGNSLSSQRNLLSKLLFPRKPTRKPMRKSENLNYLCFKKTFSFLVFFQYL